MIRQFIGSSNVYRFYKHGEFSDYPAFQMVNCTSREVFAAAVDNIGAGEGEVIVAVIENFLCDAVRDMNDPEEKNRALENAIKDYLDQVRTAATNRPGIKFALAQPTLRPLHQWYMECDETFGKKIAEGIRLMDLPNVGKIDAPVKMSQVFEQDGVHFTESSGRVYVNALLYNADAFFTAEVINLEEDMETGQKKTQAEETTTPNQITKRISVVESEIANLKEGIKRRRIDDSLVTSRIREELDFLSNVRKEDRIVVSGLTSRTPMPNGAAEKKSGSKT